MKDPWGTIRAVSLTVILGGLLVIGGGQPEPAEASAAAACQFCVSSCPADLDHFCEVNGCASHAHGHCDDEDCTPNQQPHCIPCDIHHPFMVDCFAL